MPRHSPSRRTFALLFIPLLAPAAASPRQDGPALTPDKIFAAIGVREGITVCEVGAGDGKMTLAVARLVGPAGRVYSSELGDQRVTSLKEKVADSGLAQISVVSGDVTATNFPDAACDALFMSDVYHHFSDPAAMNASMANALKPGGRAAIADFMPPDKEAPVPADRDNDGMHGVLPDTVAREMKDAGLELVASESGWRWFLSVFSKPKS